MHIEQPIQTLALDTALALAGIGHAQTVPPGFDVQPAQTLFTVTADKAATASQTLGVGGPVGQKAPFEFALAQVTQQNAPNFIVLTPSKGVAPTLVKLTLNTAVIAGMLPGSYDLSLGIRSTDLANNPGGGGGFVHLLLLPPSSPPSISAVVHGASQQPILSPGELITIYTTNLNIAPISAQSVYPTTLSNTTVTINGVSAPLLYVSPTQVNAVVPYEITLLEAQQATQPSVIAPVVVTYDFLSSTVFKVQVLPTAPGIFTVAPNGKGQGAIQNVDPQTGAVTVNSDTS